MRAFGVTPPPPVRTADDEVGSAILLPAQTKVALHNLSAPEGLPEGWIAVPMSDGSGDYYFWCPDTQEVSWQRPKREQATHRAQPSHRLHQAFPDEAGRCAPHASPGLWQHPQLTI